jgi:O-antigen ligase
MGGIVGLGLWVTLYSTALLYSWRNRDNQLVVIASSLIIFGLVAGLTEGGAILSRPKEHWFLIWIPIALLSAIWISESNKNKSVKKSD